MSGGCYKRVSSGDLFDLVNFTSSDVELSDIETSLNNIIRFTGHYSETPPLTVAQHSLLCLELSRIVEPEDNELHKAVFCHDFAEAYLGDISYPVKKAMGDRWYGFAKPIEDKVDLAILGKKVSSEMHKRVKVYDSNSLDIEGIAMWGNSYTRDVVPTKELDLGSDQEKVELFTSMPKHVNIGVMWKELCND